MGSSFGNAHPSAITPRNVKYACEKILRSPSVENCEAAARELYSFGEIVIDPKNEPIFRRVGALWVPPATANGDLS